MTASSWQKGWEPELTVNGIARPEKEKNNGWRSGPLSEEDAWLRLDIAEAPLQCVELKFDSDLSAEIMITMSKARQKMQSEGLPKTLVKEYTLEICRNGQVVQQWKVENNGQRFVRHALLTPVLADCVLLRVHSSHGCDAATVFEVRIY